MLEHHISGRLSTPFRPESLKPSNEGYLIMELFTNFWEDYSTAVQGHNQGATAEVAPKN